MRLYEPLNRSAVTAPSHLASEVCLVYLGKQTRILYPRHARITRTTYSVTYLLYFQVHLLLTAQIITTVILPLTSRNEAVSEIILPPSDGNSPAFRV